MKAVVGAAFVVEGVGSTMKADLEGSYNGAIESTGSGATVEATGTFKIGPYSAVQSSTETQTEDVSTASVSEVQLFDTTVSGTTETFENPQVIGTLTTTVPDRTTYMACYELGFNLDAAPLGSMAIDFSPEGPDLASSTNQQVTPAAQPSPGMHAMPPRIYVN